jgi:flagellar biosynthetic protein FliR
MISAPEIEIFSGHITNFLFILLRTSIFVALFPVISGQQLPLQFKMGLAVFISLLLTPVVNMQFSENQVPLLVIKEILIGLALAFTARVVFYAVNMAGLYISFSMGLAMGRVFNPETGQSTHVAELFGVITTLFFLITDAHHDLIYIFVKSFEILPGGMVNIISIIPMIVHLGGKMFVIAMKIAAPILVGLLIVHVMAGFLYKMAPQLNIFFIIMPLNIFLGFLLLAVCIPVFEYVLEINFSNMRDEMMRVIMLAKG